ncbi:hypothetical protein EYC80_006919 [Monilinia laxa]|uniref:Uncharacterized protein n=1 Tax=Monilinia laxa TaxID=61186 RepID=A0A5N6JZJ8_MONLA|nr:hypothetical protein EYC80_006919 [Monilinia laxa]
MAGTPIKIPGKNTRDSSKSAVLARKIQKRPRGRPLKLKSSKLMSHISQSLTLAPRESKVRTMKNIKSKRKMSQLEKLPTELLETIFLYCLNLSLPACSPVIGGKLSSEPVYSKTIIAAFDPIWDEWYGKIINPDLEKGYTGIDSSLQSAILRYRWAKLPVLLRSQDLWIRKYSQERPFPSSITQGMWDQHYRYDFETGIENVDPKTVSAVELFENDFAKYRYVLGSMMQASNLHEEVQHLRNMSIPTYINLPRDTEIPHTLLMGPWDEEAVRFLFWLVMGGVRIDWLTSTSGEAAIIGYKNAVRECRTEVMHLLLLAGVECKLDNDIIQYTLENADASHFTFMMVMICYLSSEHSSKRIEAIVQFRNSHEDENDVEKLKLIEEFIAW